ncbi:MAG TPA: YbaK/EbsC family protein [Kiritimatiellia bacterium]|nr:YbaK/EbsC family protein [Kiritimatiellia bacterium]
MACMETLTAYLRSNQVPFTVQTHQPAFTAREVAASAHLPALMIAKVVVVDADAQPAMLVLPAAYRVDLSRVYELLGARLVRLADERELAMIFPDCAIGAMPPFGNLYGIPVYIDPMIAAQPQIVFQPGSHTETMAISYADYARLVRPHVAQVAGELHELAAPA